MSVERNDGLDVGEKITGRFGDKGDVSKVLVDENKMTDEKLTKVILARVEKDVIAQMVVPEDSIHYEEGKFPGPEIKLFEVGQLVYFVMDEDVKELYTVNYEGQVYVDTDFDFEKNSFINDSTDSAFKVIKIFEGDELNSLDSNLLGLLIILYNERFSYQL